METLYTLHSCWQLQCIQKLVNDRLLVHATGISVRYRGEGREEGERKGGRKEGGREGGRREEGV